MLKISSGKSVILSIILSVLFMVILVAGLVLAPSIVYSLDGVKNIPDSGIPFVIAMSYLALCVMIAADAMLIILLARVRRRLVFTSFSISLVRGVSWCAIALGVVFALLGKFFLLSYFAAFACVFLGICVRVVKNVIEEATEIKSENDFTI